jgi:predicted DNA-binding transcriptional regulator YafY
MVRKVDKDQASYYIDEYIRGRSISECIAEMGVSERTFYRYIKELDKGR